LDKYLPNSTFSDALGCFNPGLNLTETISSSVNTSTQSNQTKETNSNENLEMSVEIPMISSCSTKDIQSILTPCANHNTNEEIFYYPPPILSHPFLSKRDAVFCDRTLNIPATKGNLQCGKVSYLYLLLYPFLFLFFFFYRCPMFIISIITIKSVFFNIFV